MFTCGRDDGGAAGASGRLNDGQEYPAAMAMEYRRLGRTEHRSSAITFGSAMLGRVTQEQADTAISLALEHGVNHVDVAPSYGEAELRWAPWMPRVRDRVFLGCKTTERTAA